MIASTARVDAGAPDSTDTASTATADGVVSASVLAGTPGDDRLVWNAGDGNATVDGGAGMDTLVVNGSKVADSIFVQPNAGRFLVTGHAGTDFAIDAGTIEALEIHGGAGDDTLTASNGLSTLLSLTLDGGAGNDTITGGDGADLLLGGDGNDTVTGGRGNDSALLGSGNDSFIWNPGDGSDTVDGQGGSDTLQFNGANIAETIDIAAIGNHVSFTRNVANIAMDLASIETINFKALGGADNITLHSLAGTGVRQVNLDLGDATGGGDGAVDTVAVQGSQANASLRPTLVGGVLQIDGLDVALAVKNFEASDRVLLLGTGNDSIELSRLPAGSTGPTFDAGAGDDRFVWNLAAGSASVDGGSGNDSLLVNASSNGDTISVQADGARVLVSDGTLTGAAIRATGVETVQIRGGAGDDTITASNGLSTLTTLDIDGGSGNDTLVGGDGNDRLAGGDGNDTVTGGRGNDSALLGSGNDSFIWNPGDGSDTVDGQGGSDTLQFNGANIAETIDISAVGSHVSFTRNVGNIAMDLASVETVNFGARGGSDTITVHDLAGTATKQVNLDLAAAAGGPDGAADVVNVEGSAGRDVIRPSVQNGALVVDGLAAQTVLVNFDANDLVHVLGLGGNDTLDASKLDPGGPTLDFDGGAGDDTLIGSAFGDVLSGGDDNDTLIGGAGADRLSGDAGDDRFVWNFGDGNDTVEGGEGRDTLVVNGDTVDEVMSVVVNGSRVLVTAAGFQIDAGTLEAIELHAGAGDDTLTASNGLSTLLSLTLDGGAGNDTITGGDGADLLLGGDGNDTVTGGRGNDSALLGSGNDSFIWNPGDGSDTVDGQGGSDSLQFNGANIAETIDIAAVGNHVSFTRNVGNIAMDLASIETINFRALGGADNITLHSLTGTGVRQVNLDLGDATGGGDGAVDTVAVQGSQANASLHPTLVGGVLQIDGLDVALAVKNFETSDRVLLLGTGNDSIELSRLPAGSTGPTFDAGAGDDRFVWNLAAGSASVDGGSGNDSLLVNASSNGDTISVQADGARVLVSDGTLTGAAIRAANVETVQIRGGAGDDSITAGNGLSTLTALDIDGGSGNDTLVGGDGNDRLAGGDGNDTVTGGRGNDSALLGSGNDSFIWNPGDGSDTVDGQGGSDTLQFNGANIAETIDISAVGSHVSFTRNVGNIAMDLASVETVNFGARGGSDTITVHDLAGTATKQVNLDLAAAAGGPDGAADVVNVEGSGGPDAIRFAVRDGALVIEGLPALIVIQHFDAFDEIHLFGLGPDDTVDTSGIPAGGPVISMGALAVQALAAELPGAEVSLVGLSSVLPLDASAG